MISPALRTFGQPARSSVQRADWIPSNRKEAVMVDRYTKAVLTVIAGCLLWLCLMMSGRPVEAQQLAAVPADVLPQRAQPVVIVGWGEMSTQGRIVLSLKRQPDGTTVTDTALPMRLPYTAQNPMPVAIEAHGSPIPVAVNSPIKLAYTTDAPLPVGITAIRRTGQWDEINTHVQPGPRTNLPGEPQEFD
jgi:hypothetical protein